MKARDIKKGLKERYDSKIRHYKEVQKEHYTNLRIEEFEIRQLERLLHDFFGLNLNFISKEEPEVDDVPF